MPSLDCRSLFKFGELEIVVTMHEDDCDPNFPQQENGEDAEDFVRAYRSGDLSYVGMEADVIWRGVELGTDSLWGIEHGSADDLECDAWGLVPAEYGFNESEQVKWIQMASPLTGTIIEAIDNAMERARTLKIVDPEFDAAILAAIKEFDPNSKEAQANATNVNS